MFDFLHAQKHKDELVAILAIESGKVLSMIVEYSPNQNPKICHASRHALENLGSVSQERLEPIMLTSLRRASEHLVKDGFFELEERKISHKKLSKIYVFLGSPWHISQIGSSIEKNDKPFFITEKLLQEIVDKNFKQEHPDLINIEKSVTEVKANGYRLKDPINKKVKEVEVSFFAGSAQKKIISKIEETILLSFPHTEIIFYTIPSSLYFVAKKILDKKDFILFIPEHEVSDIILIRDGKIEGTATIPYGKHRVVGAIASEMNIDIPHSFSIFRLWQEKKLEKEASDKIDSIIEKAQVECNTLISDGLWKLGSTVILPRNIVVADNGIESKLMGEWILGETYSNATLTLDNFEVAFFTFNDISKSLDSLIPTSRLNPLLGCLALFAHSV